MTQIKFFQLLNIALVIINGVVFFMPKKPVSGVHSNAAGGLVLIALAMLVIMAVHLIVLVISWYYQKTTLLTIATCIVVPLSLLFWYFVWVSQS